MEVSETVAQPPAASETGTTQQQSAVEPAPAAGDSAPAAAAPAPSDPGLPAGPAAQPEGAQPSASAAEPAAAAAVAESASQAAGGEPAAGDAKNDAAADFSMQDDVPFGSRPWTEEEVGRWPARPTPRVPHASRQLGALARAVDKHRANFKKIVQDGEFDSINRRGVTALKASQRTCSPILMCGLTRVVPPRRARTGQVEEDPEAAH